MVLASPEMIDWNWSAEGLGVAARTFCKEVGVEMDICTASPRPDSLMLRGSVELAWTLLKGHLMLQDNYGLHTDIESTC